MYYSEHDSFTRYSYSEIFLNTATLMQQKIIFKNGKPVWQQSGFVPTAELVKLFKQFQ